MGRLSTLHRSPLLWWGLPIIALALFYAGDGLRYTPSGFGGDVYFFTQYGTLGASGLLGGLAAWQAGRLRVGGVWHGAPVRHRYRIALDALRPVLLVAAVLDLAVLTLTAQHFAALPRLSDLGGIGMMLAVQLAVLVVGFGIGSLLPRAASIPAAVVGLTLWMLIPASLENPSYRYLTGVLLDRPTVVDDPAGEVLLAPLLIAVGFVVATLLAALPGRWLLRAAAAGCCVVAGVVPAGAMVADIGYEMPTVPRSESAQRCAGEAPRICVPVEFADHLPRLERSARTVLPRFEAAGLDRPEQLAFVSRKVSLPETTWRFELELPITEHQLTDRIVTALVPSTPECPDLPDDVAPSSPSPLTAWLRLTAGGERGAVERAHSAEVLKRVDAVRERERADQRTWVDTQRRALGGCDLADRRKAGR